MNTETPTRGRVSKLESLSAEQRLWLGEFASQCKLSDLVNALKERGIETSESALSRFLKKHRAEQAVADGKELEVSAQALAEQGQSGGLREGTITAVRQRLFERAMDVKDPEEARELYGALMKEEVKLKEMQLEARKVAALEQQVKLQGLRIQILAEQGSAGRGRIKAKLESSESLVDVGGEPEAKREGGGASEALQMLLRDVNEIVNRGGACEEKVLEIRARLAEGVKLLGAGGS